MNIYEKLQKIQGELKAPKSQTNTFGKYKYRSCEDILETVKPLCLLNNVALIITDELVVIGTSTPSHYTEKYYDKELKKENEKNVIVGNQRYYVKATATLIDAENGTEIKVSAYARESEDKKGMDASQITGATSSYARKYALNGLFCIDDTKDADTDEFNKNKKEEKEQEDRLVTDKEVNMLKGLLKDKTEEGTLKNINIMLRAFEKEKLEDLMMTEYVKMLQEIKKIKEKAKKKVEDVF